MKTTMINSQKNDRHRLPLLFWSQGVGIKFFQGPHCWGSNDLSFRPLLSSLSIEFIGKMDFSDVMSMSLPLPFLQSLHIDY